ncbi:MAG TPA: tetratricopeptide repeat protein, partial [Bryobacteraceae bacterium]|nr:tetratricopeptide repeat protein [Bryobacteraceae bacterium]
SLSHRAYRDVRPRAKVRRYAAILLGLLCLSAGLIAQTRPPNTDPWRNHKDYALLFATNEYATWPPLVNPVPDAKAIAQELQNGFGFETEVVTNPTREAIVAKLREYSQKPFGESDQLFIFFAGHGYYDEVFKQGYIVARDSRLDDETRGTYESYDNLRSIINAMHSKHILLVMDACYSGTFDRRIGEAGARGVESGNFSLPDLFANKVKLSTRKYLTSGGKDYVPDGEPGHHSPFAGHLLEALRSYGGSQGFLTFNNILTAVERTNPAPYWGEWGDNEPGSEFFFVSKNYSAPHVQPPAAAGVETSAAPGRARPSIAVLGFSNTSGQANQAWVSTALSEWLTSELAVGEALRGIPGDDVVNAVQELGLGPSRGYSKETLDRIHRRLEADYVVSGSYLPAPAGSQTKLGVNVWIQKTSTGEIVAGADESGMEADITDLVKRLGVRLREKLGLAAPSDEESKAVRAAQPINSEVSRLYAEGLNDLRAYDLLNARDLLQRAVAADPKFALAHQALAEAWDKLGYDNNAKQEASRALDLSGNLPSAKQRAIEGEYRQLAAEWDRAIDIYRSLWTIYPDEREYALELAATQTAGGKPKDALATLDKVRSASPEAERDPRFDFQEAVAAASLADLKREQAAASRSAERATQQGARLLASQAYWQQCSALLGLGDQKGAEASCQRANTGSDISGGQQVKARSLTVLASILESDGRGSEAMELRQEALGIARKIGSRKDIIGALSNLANLQSAQGQVEEARRGYDEALKVAQEIDDKQHLLEIELNIGALLYGQGDYSAARKMFDQSLVAASSLGDKVNVANAESNLAMVCFQLGDLSGAAKNSREAIAVSRDAGLQPLYASSLGTLGDVLVAQADLPGARKAYQEALDLFTKFNDQTDIAESRLSLAALSLEEGNASAAEALARQAAEEFQKEKVIDQEAAARDILTRTLMAQNKLAPALEEINAARNLMPHDRAIRISLDITAARLRALAGNAAEAHQLLSASFADAARLKLAGAQLEIRLAQAEVEKGSAPSASLPFIERDARKDGYLLIAQKANRLSQVH